MPSRSVVISGKRAYTSKKARNKTKTTTTKET